jgi:circadian clock protein KaiB
VTSPGRLRLYVSGGTVLSERAIANLGALRDRELAGQYELEVVDVLENPEAAEDGHLMVTPTLVRERPEPVRRLVGDLSDRTAVLASLALSDARLVASKEPQA